MSDVRKKVLLILFGHFALGLIACMAYAFIAKPDANLIAAFTGAYRLRRGLLLFIRFMPALQLSGLLLGYAIGFAAATEASVARWSAELFSYLKGAFVICIVCLGVYAVLYEGTAPLLRASVGRYETLSNEYRDCVARARDEMGRKNFKLAEANALAAQRIWKDGPEARAAAQDSQYALAQGGSAQVSTSVKGVRAGEHPSGAEAGNAADVATPDAFGATDAIGDAARRESGGLTTKGAMDLARQAIEAKDYFNAHYYASLAVRLAKPTDPNREVAQRLAADAWNKIPEGDDRSLAEAELANYRIKRRAYGALQNGDYLTAYYTFKGLRDAEVAAGDVGSDPDVAHFLEISRKGVLTTRFFTDETLTTRQYESARDVFFVMPLSEGAHAAVFIRGIAWTSSSGNDAAYLRGFDVAVFNADQSVRYHLAVPYAKLFPFANERDKTEMPELLLRSVSRDTAGDDVVPTVLAGTVSEADRNILLLDMPYRDFALIVRAGKGPSAMNLPELFSFYPLARQYGFNRESYLREILVRLVDPFLLLILSVYMLVLAWKLALRPNVLFKAWWVVALPAIPALALYGVEVVRHLALLVIDGFIALVPATPIPAVLLLLAVWFLGASVYFFSQRSE
jgi:hypothetical protein